MLRPIATINPQVNQCRHLFNLRALSKRPNDSKPKNINGTSGTARRPKNPASGKHKHNIADLSARLMFVNGCVTQKVKAGMMVPRIKKPNRTPRGVSPKIFVPSLTSCDVTNGRSLYANAGKVDSNQ